MIFEVTRDLEISKQKNTSNVPAKMSKDGDGGRKKNGMTQWERLPMLQMLPSWSSAVILPNGKLTNNELERSTMNFIWENSRNKWIYNCDFP